MLIITHRMSEPIVEWVGSSCGKHGAYTFYKGFKLATNGATRNYLLGEFYFIRNSKDRPICIAEFQLLWHDANTDDKLASARLYFRPESIPGGRRSSHGKDELLCTDEKVVIKCKDMMSLEYEGTGWSYGIKAISELNLHEVPTTGNMESEDTKKFRLLKRKSKTKNVMPKERAKMVILSFPAYCRFKSLVKKLASGVVLTKVAIKAFGGVVQCNDCTWVSFSRETFHHPGLAKFDMFMLNRAPVLKGRPRKKKASKTTSSKEELKVQQNITTVEQQVANEAESSDDNHTDTSETSSIQELPCPPKLVAKVKEEKPASVIRSVKQSVEIPPVPKLVKIEPKEPVPYGYSKPDVIYSDQLPDPHTNKNVPFKVPYSSSTIVSSQQYREDRGTNHLSFVTQPHKKCVKVEKDCSVNLPANLPANIHVSHAATITTNHHVQPRMSTIMSTTLATKGEVTQNVTTSDGNEARAEQPLKRKRGRPPGKSNKCLKSTDMKISPKTVEEVQIKEADGHGVPETLLETEEYSPEPQDAEEREFIKNLKIFMRKRGSPIDKIPALGFRKINLFKMYEVTQALGGYDQVTGKRLWRRVYSEVGGAPSITSAATNSRKHYEKLLLPYERYSRGEDYMLDLKRSETPSPTPDCLVSPRKDQNANVVSHNEAIVISQPVVSKQSVLSKPDVLPVSRIMQLNQCEKRLKPTLIDATSQRDTRPIVTDVRSQHDTLLQPAVNGIKDCRSKPVVDLRSQHDIRLESAIPSSISHQDIRLKASVSEVRGHQDTRLKTALTSVISKQGTRSKPVLSSTMNQQNTQSKPKVTAVMSQQESRSKLVVSDFGSEQDVRVKPTVSVVMGQQDTRLRPAVTDGRSQENDLFMIAVSRDAALGQKNMSNPGRMTQEQRQNVSCITSLKAQNKAATTNTSHQDRTVVSHNTERAQYTKPASLSYQQDRRSVVYTQHQHNKAADSPIEFITAGSRGSPVMLHSTNTELSTRYTTFDPQNIRHKSRPRGSNERVSTPESLRNNKKEYVTEDYYPRQNKTESRMTEFESKPKYLSRSDQVNDFGVPHDYHGEESRDMRRHARSSGDEILLTNVIPSKRAHSPHDVIYSVPVYQPSHYPHGGFEMYDLPNTAFPVHASSRIFMPPHQVFPGPGHPAFSPYTQHIIATIGTDPSTLYQLPVAGYYPQELAYPMDTGVQILHS